MRKKVFIVVLSVILGLLMIPFLVHAEFYKWIDDKGDIRFTDEYSNIPEKYLPVAETQWFPKETLFQASRKNQLLLSLQRALNLWHRKHHVCLVE